MDLIESLNVNIVEKDNSIALKLLSKHGQTTLRDKQHPTTIVQFLSRYERNEVYYKRFNSKHINECPVNGMDLLLVNENLTQNLNNYFGRQNKKQRHLNTSLFGHTTV